MNYYDYEVDDEDEDFVADETYDEIRIDDFDPFDGLDDDEDAY